MDVRSAPVGVALGLLAAFVTYLGGPTFFVLGLPLAVAALLLGAQSLALRRSAAGVASTGLGLIVLLIPVVQFAFQTWYAAVAMPIAAATQVPLVHA